MQKFRWSKVYESSEEELTEFLASRAINAVRSTGDAFEELTQTAEHDTTLWCAEGSLSIRSGSSTISLQPGDAVRIGSDSIYSTAAGISGYVLYTSTFSTIRP